MGEQLAVTSADFIRNIGYWQNEALRRPIAITHHGRERLILAAPDQFSPRNGAESDPASARAIAEIRAAGAALLEHMEEGYLALDTGLRVAGANAAAEVFLGQARETLRGATVLDVLPEPIGSIISERIQRVVRSRRPEIFECGAFDGRTASFRVFPSPPGVVALFHNSTEQAQLRKDREESEALRNAAGAHANLALLQLDARGRIESVGGAFEGWTGFAVQDVMGHRLADLAASGCRRELIGALERVLGERAIVRLPLVVLGKRGEELDGVFSLAPITADFVARGVQGVWTLGTAQMDDSP